MAGKATRRTIRKQLEQRHREKQQADADAKTAKLGGFKPITRQQMANADSLQLANLLKRA